MPQERLTFFKNFNSMGGSFHAQDVMFNSGERDHCIGITMLEYFAAQALPGVMARESNLAPDNIAKKCFAIAQAMLIEFGKIYAEKAKYP